ncbi:MAG TPA: hypothetical protein VF188_02420 [Longimicrobiales bacterium]
MASYEDEWRGRAAPGRRRDRWSRRAEIDAYRTYAGYGYDMGYGRAGVEYDYDYGVAFRRWPRRPRLPRKPARGYPVRGYHTYDLDYGDLAGPTTDYSGRAGYPTGEPPREPVFRGRYTPTLEEIGREARLRRRRYRRGAPPEYRPRRRRWRGPR